MEKENISKYYIVNEDDIVKISQLFGCLEDTLKAIIRNKNRSVDDLMDYEMLFYEASSRSLVELESDSEFKTYF